MADKSLYDTYFSTVGTRTLGARGEGRLSGISEQDWGVMTGAINPADLVEEGSAWDMVAGGALGLASGFTWGLSDLIFSDIS